MEKPLPFPSRRIRPDLAAGVPLEDRLRALSNHELEVEHQAQTLEQTLRELAQEPERLLAMRPRLEAAARSIGQRRASLQHQRREIEAAMATPRPARPAPPAAVEIQVSSRSQHTFWTDVSGDVRNGGLFVATRDMLASGTRLLIRLGLPGRGAQNVWAEVVWHREPSAFTGDLPPGLGLRLLDPDIGLLSDIQAFTQHCPALVFELVA